MRKITILSLFIPLALATASAQEPAMNIETVDSVGKNQVWHMTPNTVQYFSINPEEDGQIRGSIVQHSSTELEIKSEIEVPCGGESYLYISDIPGFKMYEEASFIRSANPQVLLGQYKAGSWRNGYLNEGYVEFEYGQTYYYRFLYSLKTANGKQFDYYSKERSISILRPMQMVYDNSGLERGFFQLEDGKSIALDDTAFIRRNESLVGNPASTTLSSILKDYWLKFADGTDIETLPHDETADGNLYYADISEYETEILSAIQEEECSGTYPLSQLDFDAPSAVFDKFENCPDSLGLPNNEYYEFIPNVASTLNIEINLPKLLLGGKTYRISLITAPLTRDTTEMSDVQKKRYERPHTIDYVYAYSDGEKIQTFNTYSQTINSNETQTIPVGEVSMPRLTTSNKLSLKAGVRSSETNKKSPYLRISAILIEPIDANGIYY